MRSHPSRRRGHRGAVAVEAALVTPILLVLVFGIIDFGFVFKDWIAVTSSTRAGTRVASAEPRQDAYAEDAAMQVAREGTALDTDGIEEVWVYQAGDDGYPTGGTGDFASCNKCVKFHWDDGAAKLVEYADTWPALTQNACPGDPLRDSIGVYVSYDHSAAIGLFFDTLTIDDHSVMDLEPMSPTTICKPA